ncbi:MAG: M36 family metallopeptidase, partial [Actinomycetota bacterium]
MDERTERHERPERSAPPDRPGRTTRRRSRRRAAAAAGLTIGAASIFVFGGVSGGLAGGDGDEPVEHPARLGTSTPTKVALDHLQSLAVATAPVGFAGSDRPLELVVDSTARTEHAAVTHVYVQQRLDGVDVVGATANVAVTDDGVVAHDPNSLVGPDLAAASDLSDLVDAGAGAIVDPVAAVAAALVALDVTPSEPLAAVGPPRGSERRQLVSDGGVASGAIEARLVHVPVDKELVLGWEVRVDLLGGDHLQLTVAVQDGRELDRQSYTISHTYVPAEEVFGEEVFGEEMFAEEVFGDGLDPIDDPLVVRTTGAGRPEPARTGATGDLTDGSSYRVFPLPIEAPAFGNPSVVSDPADPAASPFGWHDTDGVAGAESTLTTGNNVDAYLDLDS